MFWIDVYRLGLIESLVVFRHITTIKLQVSTLLERLSYMPVGSTINRLIDSKTDTNTNIIK